MQVKIKVPYPNWGIDEVLISLSMAIEPIGG